MTTIEWLGETAQAAMRLGAILGLTLAFVVGSGCDGTEKGPPTSVTPGKKEERPPKNPDEQPAAQIKEWARRLRAESPPERRTLMIFLREEATRENGGHPPTAPSKKPELIPLFQLGLEDADSDVRTQSICALAYMNHPSAFPILSNSLRNADGIVRYYAVMGIGWLGRLSSLRQDALEALGNARDPRKEPWIDVRLGAASSLLELDASPGADVFIEALRRPDANHALAASAVAKLGRKDTIALLINRLATAEPDTDRWIGKALEQLTGKSLGRDYAKWREWYQENGKGLPKQID